MSSRDRVLLLEDDANLGLVVQEHLQMHGFEVSLCVNGEEGIEVFSKGRYDLCLIDIMMPRKDGFEFAREIRRRDQHTPFIFLTAKSLKEDRIKGFKIGCDDYVTKPFSIEELLLRVQAVLRRSRGEPPGQSNQIEFEIGQFHFDSNRRLLSRQNREYKLTPRESDLLRLLVLKKNRILERQEALHRIWGDDSYFSGRSMDVFISRLRKYLKEDSRVEIVAVHGKGFRLVVG